VTGIIMMSHEHNNEHDNEHDNEHFDIMGIIQLIIAFVVIIIYSSFVVIIYFIPENKMITLSNVISFVMLIHVMDY
jgi:magnesium-transporting ATPase (P-type)